MKQVVVDIDGNTYRFDYDENTTMDLFEQVVDFLFNELDLNYHFADDDSTEEIE